MVIKLTPQAAQVKEILLTSGSITTPEAIKLNILRLAGRILTLRKSGMDIKRVFVPKKTGRGVYAKYTLVWR